MYVAFQFYAVIHEPFLTTEHRLVIQLVTITVDFMLNKALIVFCKRCN